MVLADPQGTPPKCHFTILQLIESEKTVKLRPQISSKLLCYSLSSDVEISCRIRVFRETYAEREEGSLKTLAPLQTSVAE